MKYNRERQNKKKVEEIDGVYNQLKDIFAKKVGAEWTDLILKVSHQKKKKKVKKSSKSKSNRSSGLDLKSKFIHSNKVHIHRLG